MTQWSRRSAGKTIEELEEWAETLGNIINNSPKPLPNLTVKRRWLLEIITGRRQEQQ